MSMKFVGAAIVLGLALVACNNDQGVFPPGVPTAIVTLNGIEASLGGGQGTAKYKVQATTLPGSSGGFVQAFVTRSGKDLPIGLAVDRCPVLPADKGGGLNQKNCGPFTTNDISQSFPSTSVDDFDIVGVRVQGENGISKTIQWTGSQPLLVQVTQ
jgi:hypothetical protein